MAPHLCTVRVRVPSSWARVFSRSCTFERGNLMRRPQHLQCISARAIETRLYTRELPRRCWSLAVAAARLDGRMPSSLGAAP